MARFYTIDVVVIQSDIPRSHFPEDELDTLAQHILEAKGLIRPLILEETGLERYSVIDGHFEFYAAVRAHEKDRLAGEMVNAFVISKKEKEYVLAQLKSLDRDRPVPSGAASSSPVSVSGTDGTRLDNIDKHLENIVEQIREQRSELTAYKSALEKANREALANKFPSLLAEINGLTGNKLAKRLSIYGLKKNVVEIVVTARRDRGNEGFVNYKDLTDRVNGLGAAGLLNAIAKWEQINHTD